MASFLHVGDIHIGTERLDGRLPSSDFANAFDQAVDAAIQHRVDFVLVAGDFFNKSRIEPNHLSEGERGLERLRQADIPVIAIEGNHDLASSFDSRPSWLSYLNERGLIRLLRTEFRDGNPIMREWTDSDRRGNWLDLAGARIVGAGYFGASTARRIELLGPVLSRHGFTILMLHAGVDRLHDEFGHISSQDLARWRDRIDYIALGHIHRRYTIDDWIYNPGALEHWRLDEEAYGDEKGYFLVQFDTHTKKVEHHSVRRRPVLLACIPLDDLASHEELSARVRQTAATWRGPRETAIHLSLTGQPLFDACEIDARQVAACAEKCFPCAGIDVVLPMAKAAVDPLRPDTIQTPRETIEEEELKKLIVATGRYADQTKEMVAFVRQALALSARDLSDEELYTYLLQAAQPLLGNTAQTISSTPLVST